MLAVRGRAPLTTAARARPRRLGTAALVLAVIVVFAGTAVTSTPGALAAIAVPLVVVLCCLPAWWLPSIALVTFAVIPVGYLTAVPQFLGRFLTPTLLVLLIWLVRTRHSARDTPPRPLLLRWSLVSTALLVVLAQLSVNQPRSYLWVGVFVLACVLPALRGGRVDPRTVPALIASWLAVGAALSVLAGLESLSRFNPLTRYYSIDQHWAVYRVTTLLGHPLMNGTFFALTGCLALFTALRRGPLRPLATPTFVLASIAAALSGSRSGVYALVIGLAAGLLVLLWSRQLAFGPKVAGVGLALAAVVVIPVLPVFAERAGSAEAAASRVYRDDVLALTRRLFAVDPLFGGGPGTSAILADRAGASLPLESAVLGSLVSLGVVGCAALVVLVGLLAGTAIRRRRPEALAGVAAFLVAGAAFPLWETNPAAWSLLGLLAVVGAEPLTTDAAAADRLGPLRVPRRSASDDAQPRRQSDQLLSSSHRRVLRAVRPRRGHTDDEQRTSVGRAPR